LKSIEKIHLIKNYLDKNKIIVEENKELFATQNILEKLLQLNQNVQNNKFLSTASKPQSHLMDLISIPFHMINSFRNNSLGIYLEYKNYLNDISITQENSLPIINHLKETAGKINKIVSNLIIKILGQDEGILKTDWNLEEINDILELPLNEIFKNNKNELISLYSDNDQQINFLKKLNTILYSISLNYNNLILYLESNKINFNLILKKFKKFLNFSIQKINLVFKTENEQRINNDNFLELELIYYKKLIIHFLEKFVLELIKKYILINGSNKNTNNISRNNNNKLKLDPEIELYKDYKNLIFEFISELLKSNSYLLEYNNSDKKKDEKNYEIISQLKLEFANNFKNILGEIYQILNTNFNLYLDSIIKINENSVRRYLLGTKDVRKLLTTENQQPFNSSNSNNIENSSEPNSNTNSNNINTSTEVSYIDPNKLQKFEFLVILYNNLQEIFNIITQENSYILVYPELKLISVKEKHNLIEKFEGHCDVILNLINNFFYDNLFVIKSSSMVTEVEYFKNCLLNLKNENGKIIEFVRELYQLLGLRKLWENKINKKEKSLWENFLSSKLEEIKRE